MNNRSLIICLMAAVLIFVAAPATAADRVIGRVGAEPITQGEVDRVMAEDLKLSRDRAMEVLVDRKLILNWAGEHDLTANESEIDDVMANLARRNKMTPEQFARALEQQGGTVAAFRRSLREQLLISKAIRTALADRMRITEKEITEAYTTNYPPRLQYGISHILIAVGEGAGEAAAEEAGRRARELMSALDAGENFEELARRRSDDSSSAAEGGRLGTFAEGELMSGLEDAVRDLSPGETAGPVRTRLGYHVVRLDSRRQMDPPPLAEVREELNRKLLADREQEVRSRWLSQLRTDTYVELFPE